MRLIFSALAFLALAGCAAGTHNEKTSPANGRNPDGSPIGLPPPPPFNGETLQDYLDHKPG